MATPVENPRRVVVRRTKNYKAVHRPSKWGNPFDLKTYGREEALELYEKCLANLLAHDPDFLEPLRGYNLGCFCSLNVACHADVILRKLYDQDEGRQ